MQQTADLLKGTHKHTGIHGYLQGSDTGDITACQTGHAVYKHSITLYIIVEYLTCACLDMND